MAGSGYLDNNLDMRVAKEGLTFGLRAADEHTAEKILDMLRNGKKSVSRDAGSECREDVSGNGRSKPHPPSYPRADRRNAAT
jgi:hypothetical protein